APGWRDNECWRPAPALALALAPSIIARRDSGMNGVEQNRNQHSDAQPRITATTAAFLLTDLSSRDAPMHELLEIQKQLEGQKLGHTVRALHSRVRYLLSVKQAEEAERKAKIAAILMESHTYSEDEDDNRPAPLLVFISPTPLPKAVEPLEIIEGDEAAPIEIDSDSESSYSVSTCFTCSPSTTPFHCHASAADSADAPILIDDSDEEMEEDRSTSDKIAIPSASLASAPVPSSSADNEPGDEYLEEDEVVRDVDHEEEVRDDEEPEEDVELPESIVGVPLCKFEKREARPPTIPRCASPVVDYSRYNREYSGTATVGALPVPHKRQDSRYPDHSRYPNHSRY
ncbi:hypothetical protein PFISCL1PPCAC_8556, partial [Pristionchus fissidentatus]